MFRIARIVGFALNFYLTTPRQCRAPAEATKSHTVPGLEDFIRIVRILDFALILYLPNRYWRSGAYMACDSVQHKSKLHWTFAWSKTYFLLGACAHLHLRADKSKSSRTAATFIFYFLLGAACACSCAAGNSTVGGGVGTPNEINELAGWAPAVLTCCFRYVFSSCQRRFFSVYVA